MIKTDARVRLQVMESPNQGSKILLKDLLV